MKQDYINYVNGNFEGKSKELLLNQIELFYKDEFINNDRVNRMAYTTD